MGDALDHDENTHPIIFAYLDGKSEKNARQVGKPSPQLMSEKKRKTTLWVGDAFVKNRENRCFSTNET